MPEHSRSQITHWFRVACIVLRTLSPLLRGAALLLIIALPLLMLASWNIGSSGKAHVPATRATMKTVEGMLTTYALDYGALPPSLAPLVPSYTEKLPIDAWRGPLIYTLEPNGTALLVSLGANGRPGGWGQDTDLWFRFSTSSFTEGTGTPPPIQPSR